jgi:hypothetical protein
MIPAIEPEKNPRLHANSLGFAESVIMGIAGSGPAYSVAASTATLIGAVGVLAPASLLYCGLIMFGIVFAFRHLNRLVVNAGASYAWVGAIFSPAIGFFAGWALIIKISHTGKVDGRAAAVFPMTRRSIAIPLLDRRPPKPRFPQPGFSSWEP